MEKQLCCFFCLICIVVLSAGCAPSTFSPPTQIHIISGDHVEQPVIAMDAAGRSHIAGIANDRIVYYRTTFGEPNVTLTMTMGGAGANWKQYSPDIAVTDAGTAWLVWVEQRGGPEMYTCYQEVPLIPSMGGYDTGCHNLSTSFFSAGNVMVVTRGSKAYVLYDGMDSRGRIGYLFFTELTQPSNHGIIYSYTDSFQSGYLYSWDAGIDNAGFLHVVFHDDDGNGTPPYNESLKYRSNRSTQIDGDMNQSWNIISTNFLEEIAPISLTFYMVGVSERLAVSSVYNSAANDQIRLDRCATNGCDNQSSQFVYLPLEWFTYSNIRDVELLGIGPSLHLGFIGRFNPVLYPQIFYIDDALSSDPPLELSENRDTFKYDLEVVERNSRPGTGFAISFTGFSWGETEFSSVEYYSYALGETIKVYESTCTSSSVEGESASNGVYFAGVWEACLGPLFSTQAYLNQLPLIVK